MEHVTRELVHVIVHSLAFLARYKAHRTTAESIQHKAKPTLFAEAEQAIRANRAFA